MTSPDTAAVDTAAVPTRAYLPGEWYVVLGAEVVVALPSEERERAAAAWSLVEAGASADEVLDALLGAGLSTLGGLALVSEHDGATRVLLRGRAGWSGDGADGPVEATGGLASTWHEQRVRGVRSWTLDLPGAVVERGAHAGEPDHDPEQQGWPVAAGLVRAACVRHGAVLARPEAPAAAVAPAAQPDPDPEPDPEPPSEPEPEPEPVDETPVTPSAWSPGQSDHDGMTKSGDWGREEFQRHQPGIPGQPQAPSITASPVARLVVSHGEEVEVDRVVLVGRAPEARRFTSTEQPRLVTVPSPQQEISSTHLEVRPGSGADHGSAVVTDLGSTNGTVLVQPGLPPESLQPGIAVQLIPGAIIDLGDGVSIQVVRP
ncbi:hypothetical protein BKA08_000583 [Nocardioides marinisabuli]|uniref:FHA domain-containing protein n=1 Tax=Nocardioides marinisabuli TaxID=419476 RepID=A0A7Y9F082_9ACTN|nr:FHA domain-containing protein [Nocardioides marinisabuli]NYD56345.1 hypothetical protein [Nocardioides marinisabuli]